MKIMIINLLLEDEIRKNTLRIKKGRNEIFLNSSETVGFIT